MDKKPTSGTEKSDAKPVAEATDAQKPATVADGEQKAVAEASDTQKSSKKSKIGIIIGAIIGVLALAGVIVAVVLARPSRDANAFEKAQEKALSLSEARNIKLDGYIKLTPTSYSSSLSQVNLNLSGQFAGTLSIGDLKLAMEIGLEGGQTISPELEIITTATGDYYVKPGGLGQSFSKLTGYSYNILPKNNPIVSLIDEIENQWLLISADDIEDAMDSTTSKAASETMTCVSEYWSTLQQNRYELANLYKKYPYLVASQENIKIAQKANPIYKVTFDKDNISKAMKEPSLLDATNQFGRCLGSSESLNDESFERLSSWMANQEFYLEIDSNYDITRMYMDFDMGVARMVADFDIAYPDVVNIAEPTEYKNFSDIFEKFIQNMSIMMQES